MRKREETGDKGQSDIVLSLDTEKVGVRGRTAEELMILERRNGLGFRGCSRGTIEACQRLRLDLLGHRSVLRKLSGPGLTESLLEVLVLCSAGAEVRGNFQASRKTFQARQS